MKLKILCIGDSLCLPREDVPYEDTWIYLLKNQYKDIDFINYFKRGATISLMEESFFESYYQFYKPNIVIWESGITDCAPRYLNDNNLGWRLWFKLIHFTIVERLFWKYYKMTHSRRSDTVYTPIDVFEVKVDSLIKKFLSVGVQKIILIKMEQIGAAAQKRNLYWMSNIKKYNAIYEKMKTKFPNNIILIDPMGNVCDDCFVIDGYHNNAKGMKLTFDGINDILKTLIKQ